MEVMEILVYFGFIVLIGGFIIGFISGWDFKQGYDDLKHLMMNEDEKLEFEKVDITTFAGKLHLFSNECINTGFNMSMSMYVVDNQTLTKERLFQIFKDLKWCDTIQSVEHDCGYREDVVMNDINLPKVLRLNCTNETIYIK
jgi:hypothetical protein